MSHARAGALDTTVEAPIFVIGTHRSGTTLLGTALGQHPDVAYWEEPRHVWSWGHNYKRDDLLAAGDATPRIKAHIRRQFASFLKSSGRSRFAEKTPNNCLRLPFIREIFPDALFIHVFRDGRAVVHSTDVVTRTRFSETRWFGPRLLGTPVWEWPALIPRAWRTAVQRFLGKEMAFWGPLPPGWREWVRTDARPVALAKQWRYTIEPVLEFRSTMPDAHWLDIRYEDLVADPRAHAGRIALFARLARADELKNHLERECDPTRVDRWRLAFDENQLRQVRPIIEPILERLGYQW